MSRMIISFAHLSSRKQGIKAMRLFPLLLALLMTILSGPALHSAEQVVFDFESGSLDGEGWRVVEGVNTKPVGNREFEYNNPNKKYEKRGRYYLTTLEQAVNDRPTDDTVCVLESPVFVIQGDEARLLIGGGSRPGTYAGLCPVTDDGSVGKPVLEARGQNSESLHETVWDTSKLKGKAFVLQVVDRETGGWAHIRMDDFRAEGRIDEAKTDLRKRYLEDVVTKKEAEEKARIEAAKTNPFLSAQPIIYVTRKQYRLDHHNTETLFQAGEINEEKFEGGGSLRLWNPKDDSVRILLEVPAGVVRDPCLSFDAKRLLVSIRRNIEDDYHIYELELAELLEKASKPLIVKPDEKSDASFLRQLTQLPGVSDIDPLYLPNGQIIFSATREPKFCMCNRHIMCNLYKMNGDGSNIHQIGKNTLFEGHASLLPDGRILYDRWEYVDRNFGDAQGVWMTTDEGFNHAIFWGNNTASPGGVIDARILPGSSSVFVATFSSCHDRPWGAVALIDRQLGIDGKQAVLQTWPASAVDLVDAGNYDTFIRVRPKLEDPFPLSDQWFLASGMTGKGERMGIYLLGRDGTMLLVHDDKDAPGCYDPTPLSRVPPPPMHAGKADYSQSTGVFTVMNVYEGYGMEKVKKGDAKFIRVIESPEKRTWSSSGWDNGTGEQAPGMAWKDFNNKRILGTVPTEDDGSVGFEVPADTFLYLQLLDEKGRMIQSMRSGMIVRPGETNGCFGCHEDRLATFPSLVRTPKAMKNPPTPMNGWHGPPRLFSYVKEVQEPVFDQYCVTCHDYGKVEQNERMPNLAGDRNTIFNTSYVEIQRRGLVKAVGAGSHVKLEPYSWGSTQSRLAEVMCDGHADPAIDQERKKRGVYVDAETHPDVVDRVMTWIDVNTPYYGTYSTSFPNGRYGRCPISNAEFGRLAELTGVKGRDLDWGISFDRPERSPCLSKWKTAADRKTPEYVEALAIITHGKHALEKTPRGEDPDGVPVPPRDAKQQEKYDRLKEIERRMREAIVNGEKLYDRDFR